MNIKKYVLVLVFLLGAHLFLLINLRFTAWPEMISFSYLLNNRFNLYGDMVHAYPPLLTLVLAGVYKVFGYHLLTLKVFTWTGIILSDIFIFLIVKEITKKVAPGLFAVAFYILTQSYLDGNMLWFDTALTLPLLLLIYFRKNRWLSGIMVGILLLIKQTSIVYALAYLGYLIVSRVPFKQIVNYLTPIAIITLTFLGYLFFNGNLSHFINWNFYYPSVYWTTYPSYEILAMTRRELLSVLLVVAPGVYLLLKSKRTGMGKSTNLVLLLLLVSIVAVYPRFSFYHFQPVIAVSAVTFGLIYNLFGKHKTVAPAYLAILFIQIALPTTKLDWQKETRFWGSSETSFANTIKENVGEGAVYLLGPNSINYPLTGTLPPKPWLDNFGWYFEVPGEQEKTIDSWNINPPESIIIGDPIPGEWYMIGTYMPKEVLTWIESSYTKEKEINPGIWLWRLKE